MYYLQSRYYDPELGRFINADGLINNSFKGLNQFAYCVINPVNCIDQTGKWGERIKNIFAGVVNAVEDAAIDAGKFVIKRFVKNYLKPRVDYAEVWYKFFVRGTSAVSVNLSGAFGVAGSASAGVAIGHDGDVGMYYSAGIGGGIPSFSGGVGISFTNAPSITNLNGIGTQTGGSISMGSLNIGADVSIFNNNGNTYSGVGAVVGIGVKPIPVELHSVITQTTVISFNLFESSDTFYQIIMGL